MHWNTYAPIYFGEFDSFDRSNAIGETPYQIKYTIYKKNYVGPISSLICAGEPLVQRYLEDNPIAPIKGCEVEIKFLNKDRLMPLSLFYSEEDDTFKIIVERVGFPNNQRLFEGYMVQNECTEILVDFTHELSLVFTDNIGLLKNVKLDQGARVVAKTEADWRHYVNAVTQYNGYFEMLPNLDPAKDPKIGDTMILESDGGDTIYAVIDVKQVGSGVNTRVHVYVDLAMPNVGNGTLWASVFFITPHNIQQRMKLGDIMKICLQNSGMMLDCYYSNYAQVKLAGGTFTSRLPENIYIDCKTFKSGDDYDTLYDILEKILKRFTGTLFQCKGVWKMHRWLELPIVNDGQLLAKIYNPYFVFQFSTLSSWRMDYGYGTDIETGANETIVRPLKYVKDTFSFEQPTDMLFNYKLDFLGEYLGQFNYTVGAETFTVKKYEALGWQNNLGSPFYFNPRDLRIVYDAFGNEVDRYIALNINPLNTTISPPPYLKHRTVGATTIEVNKGDVIKYSFDWKGFGFDSSAHTLNFNPLMLNTTTQEYYVSPSGEWVINNDPFPVYYPPNTDFNEWQTVSVETKPIPFDGLLTVWITYRGFGDDSYYKNFNFEYIPYMGGRSDVKKQSHTTTMQGNIKNVVDEEIAIDDTVKNYAKGTLFLPTFTNLIQDKTANWQDGVISRQMKLGEIITRQLNLWRYMQRSKIELNMWPLKKYENMLGMDTAINYQIKPGFFYIFGKLEINYKENQASGTIYEIFNPVDTETSVDGVDRLSKLSYQFQYLFK